MARSSDAIKMQEVVAFGEKGERRYEKTHYRCSGTDVTLASFAFHIQLPIQKDLVNMP